MERDAKPSARVQSPVSVEYRKGRIKSCNQTTKRARRKTPKHYATSTVPDSGGKLSIRRAGQKHVVVEGE
jgi:hypothetical protein